jgi:hypothetical protein
MRKLGRRSNPCLLCPTGYIFGVALMRSDTEKMACPLHATPVAACTATLMCELKERRRGAHSSEIYLSESTDRSFPRSISRRQEWVPLRHLRECIWLSDMFTMYPRIHLSHLLVLCRPSIYDAHCTHIRCCLNKN